MYMYVFLCLYQPNVSTVVHVKMLVAISLWFDWPTTIVEWRRFRCGRARRRRASLWAAIAQYHGAQDEDSHLHVSRVRSSATHRALEGAWRTTHVYRCVALHYSRPLSHPLRIEACRQHRRGSGNTFTIPHYIVIFYFFVWSIKKERPLLLA